MLNINKIFFIFSYIIMVRYYGRAKTRTGSVNTNQLGLKMSGCPSRVGRNPVNARYISQRVACNRGICGIPVVHEVIPWRYDMSNSSHFGRNFCQPRSTTCLAAAGGIGNINTPYYRTPAPGEGGCATGLDNPISIMLLSLEYENLANDTEVDNVTLPVGTKVIVTTDSGNSFPATAAASPIVTKDSSGKQHTLQTLIARTKQVIKNVGSGFKHVIQKVEAGVANGVDKAGDLEHKAINGAKKVISKIGHAINHVAVDVENRFSKGESKLKNSVKAAAHHVAQKVVQAAKGVEQAAKDKLEEKLAEKIAKVAHMAQEVHDVVRKGKKFVKKIEEAPEKIKQKFKEDVDHAKGQMKGIVNKETNKIEEKVHHAAKKISSLFHHHHHEHEHHRRRRHGHHGGLKRLIHKL